MFGQTTHTGTGHPYQELVPLPDNVASAGLARRAGRGNGSITCSRLALWIYDPGHTPACGYAHRGEARLGSAAKSTVVTGDDPNEKFRSPIRAEIDSNDLRGGLRRRRRI